MATREAETKAAAGLSEEQWLDRREQLARQAIERAVVALGRDAGHALGRPRERGIHPDAEAALARVGRILTNDLVLDRIESSLAGVMAPSGTLMGRVTEAALSVFHVLRAGRGSTASGASAERRGRSAPRRSQ